MTPCRQIDALGRGVAPAGGHLAICRLLGAMLVFSATACGPASDSTGRLTVAAAASLRRVMPEIVESYPAATEGEIVVTYGASGDLRRQVEGGAPIEALVLASAEDVDALIRDGLAEAATRRVVARNLLVLIGTPNSRELTFSGLGSLPPEARIAIGDPRTVPAGRYARRAFESLGLWQRLEPQLVYGGHVASVLTYARRGEVEAAVVYRTEARGIDDVVVLDEATGAWAPAPLVVAVAMRPPSAPARRFVDFLASDGGREIFLRYGFRSPQQDESL